jgi:thioesterase domain-containing protein
VGSALPEKVVPLRAGGSRPPLYCVHAIAGSAYAYDGLARLLDPDQPVYGFESPGFDDDREPVTVLEDLAAEYVDELLKWRPGESYRLLGWSMGGALAFAMAQRLVAAGAEVPMLIVVDSSVPTKPWLPSEQEMLRTYLVDLKGLAGGDPTEGVDELFAQLPPDPAPSKVFEHMASTKALLDDISYDFLWQGWVLFRAHAEALYGYEIREQYHGPLTFIAASHSPMEIMRWETVASDVRKYRVPGNHFSIWRGESLAAMSAIVTRALEASWPATTTPGS